MKEEIRKQIDKMMNGLNRDSILSMICQVSDVNKDISPKNMLNKMVEDGFFIEQISEGKANYQFTGATVAILEAFAFTHITSMQNQFTSMQNQSNKDRRGVKKW